MIASVSKGPKGRPPRLSVIIPAHGVEAFLPQCLESVSVQSYTDFEVVVVDDHSPDRCGSIADAYSARDARFSVVHHDVNRGLGPARNTGIGRATGDYLVFLDGDDELAPGALAEIARRLAETADPDVLVYAFARGYPDGRTERDGRSEMLAAMRGTFPLTSHPELLGLIWVAWNKAYRRSYVLDNGFEFPAGYYEDTPWTCPVLLRAARLAALDVVCVRYRQQRAGSILRTASRRHLEIFDQFDRLFAFLDRNPDLESWRPVVFVWTIEKLLSLGCSPRRLPASARVEFRRRCVEHYVRHEPNGHVPPAGLKGLHYRLMKQGGVRTGGARPGID